MDSGFSAEGPSCSRAPRRLRVARWSQFMYRQEVFLLLGMAVEAVRGFFEAVARDGQFPGAGGFPGPSLDIFQGQSLGSLKQFLRKRFKTNLYTLPGHQC